MRTLQRVLASGVLEALRARAHLQVAQESSDAVVDEVEAIIAPALSTIRPKVGEHRTLGEADTRAAVESIVDRITQRLMESDHIDDIFADDRVIRRDAFRAIRDILLGYIRGELEVDEEVDTGAFEVRLDGLGYLVATASRRLDESLLVEALDRAGAATGANLSEYDPARNTATFARVGGAEAGRLALEEAITEELSGLVDADVVALPGMQQVLEVARGSVDQPGFDAAVERAISRIQRQVGCAASCAIIDERTLVACLTPLSDDTAERAEEYFGRFVALLEEELSALEASATEVAKGAAKRSGRSAARRKGSSSSPPRRAAKRTTSKSTAPRAKRTSKTKATLQTSELARPSGTRARAAKTPAKRRAR
jgi:hypothetical protein